MSIYWSTHCSIVSIYLCICLSVDPSTYLFIHPSIDLSIISVCLSDYLTIYLSGLPWWLSCKESACQSRRLRFDSLGLEDPLEKGIATHCRILAWRIPWTEQPVELLSTGSQKNQTRLTNLTTTACIYPSIDPSVCLSISLSAVYLSFILIYLYIYPPTHPSIISIYKYINIYVYIQRRQWQPTPVFLPGESQGQRSLLGCCLRGRTESDTTEAT